MTRYNKILKEIVEKGQGQYIGIRYIIGGEPMVSFYDRKGHVRNLTVGKCTPKNVLKKVCETL